jgi:OOP family OmpA-OmpF porin
MVFSLVEKGGPEMKRFFSMCVAVVAVVGVGACAGTKLQETEGMQPQGSQFDVALSDGYKSLATSEYTEGDYTSSDTFAERAIAAGTGNAPAPEDIGARSLPPESVGELSASRDRLVTALNNGGGSVAPADAAEAQIMFDCWMQEQEENWSFQQDQIAACKQGYMDAIARVEAALAPGEAPPPVVAGPNTFVVFFDFDSDALTADQSATVSQAADEAKSRNAEKIVVVGNTDSSGSAAYNLGLSLRRAEAVKSELVLSGIPAENIETIGKGQEEALLQINDGVRDPQFRRADIQLSTGDAGANAQPVLGNDVSAEVGATVHAVPAQEVGITQTSSNLRGDLAARGVPAAMIDVFLDDTHANNGTIQ